MGEIVSKDAFEAGILKEERPEGIVGRKNETKKKGNPKIGEGRAIADAFVELARWFAA
jgi:hypothetical protein